MSIEPITFITGNQGKLKELQALLPTTPSGLTTSPAGLRSTGRGTGCGIQVQGLALELPEIQDVDIQKIVEHKLHSALAHCPGPLLVDDTALYLECMASPDGTDGLPGPLIKWFLHTMGNVNLAQLAQNMGNTRARVCTVLGYADKAGNCHLFEGSVVGQVVDPQGTTGFGWDHIFLPDGHHETFARMGFERKNQISQRSLAVQELCEFLAEK